MSHDATALVIDDTDANRIFFERLINQASFNVYSASTGQCALELIDQFDSLDLAIIDMEMPDMSGLELTHRVRRQFPDACIIVATMYDERSLMESAYRKGCDIFLVKPHGFMDLYKKLTLEGADALHQQSPLVIDQYGLRPFKSKALTS